MDYYLYEGSNSQDIFNEINDFQSDQQSIQPIQTQLECPTSKSIVIKSPLDYTPWIE